MAIAFRSRGIALFLAFLLPPAPAGAVLDLDDRGPVLGAGGFAMRITNAGILGNAFFDVGRSSDPSFEFPPHSGHELLNYAALWVGGRTESGERRVSGGPLLEWRPTLAADDRVREAWHGRLGSRRLVDDDGDGSIDEEELNGRDDDGDGEIDEDLGFTAQQMLTADYADDRPEATRSAYEGGENHRPLGLSVHQEVYGWAAAGYSGIAGLHFRITNHGAAGLSDLYVGLLADLDSRRRDDRTGHLDDRVLRRAFSRTINEGTSFISPGGAASAFPCIRTLEQTLPVLADGIPGAGLPVIAAVPLDHTTDPLALIEPARTFARAPGQVSFRSAVYSRRRVPGQGGVPQVDEQRYEALAGSFPESPADEPDDYVVLVACGPFPSLAPGQSIEFTAALVAASGLDSLQVAVENALLLHHGTRLNLLPDVTGANPFAWFEGRTGINGHEACVEPPPGVSFVFDPHCPDKFPSEARPPDLQETYRSGTCVWTDADCDPCTGFGGRETVLRWLDPGAVPPSPSVRLTPLDHAVRIEWDNLPEVLIAAGAAAAPNSRFVGYRVYKLADWRDRASLLPPRGNWALLAAFGPDRDFGEIPLAAVRDTSLDYERILYRQRLYPVGRYALTDPEALNGFDYAYAVTTVSETAPLQPGRPGARHESPLIAAFGQRVSPHAAARGDARSVWVVPNPYRARASWERPPVIGDPRTRHVDFMGLPRARCVIRVWTLAGDLVAELHHDGARGDGQVAWDLVSRNGQDVESGIYLFTVDSALGLQRGRFVVIR